MSLKFKEFFGTVAKDIYIECGKKYNWNYLMKNLFTFRHSLYAKNAAPQGLSVWFICYSNLTQEKVQIYENVFFGADYYRIDERWFLDTKQKEVACGKITEEDIRIVFAKRYRGRTEKYEYSFMGIYKPTVIKEEKKLIDGLEMKYWVRSFERISEVYPM